MRPLSSRNVHQEEKVWWEVCYTHLGNDPVTIRVKIFNQAFWGDRKALKMTGPWQPSLSLQSKSRHTKFTDQSKCIWWKNTKYKYRYIHIISQKLRALSKRSLKCQVDSIEKDLTGKVKFTELKREKNSAECKSCANRRVDRSWAGKEIIR